MNYELENKVTHLEAENEGLRKLVQGKNELLKKALEENDSLRSRISMLKGEQS